MWTSSLRISTQITFIRTYKREIIPKRARFLLPFQEKHLGVRYSMCCIKSLYSPLAKPFLLSHFFQFYFLRFGFLSSPNEECYRLGGWSEHLWFIYESDTSSTKAMLTKILHLLRCYTYTIEGWECALQRWCGVKNCNVLYLLFVKIFVL